MIVQVNGEDHQFDRAALCVLQHLKVIHGPPEAARQDYEPAADLAFALARAAQRRLEMLSPSPSDLSDDYDAKAPLRVFITTDEPEATDRTVLFRRSFSGQYLEALRRVTCEPPSPAGHPVEAIEAVAKLVDDLGMQWS